MESYLSFTNERLSKRFKSNFELVNYAIRLAENAIRSGREVTNLQKDSMVVSLLKEIIEGKEVFVPIQVIVEAPKQERVAEHKMESIKEESYADRKKSKKRVLLDDTDI